MKMAKKIDPLKVYHACNRFNWFTAGSNEQYDKLFTKVEAGASIGEIALLIWMCTPDVGENEIKTMLQDYCHEDLFS